MMRSENGMTLVAKFMVVLVIMMLLGVTISLLLADGGLVNLTQKTNVYPANETSINSVENK